MACWTILKKKTCLGIVSACRIVPVVSLHLKNTADYRFPTFWPQITKLGHSWLLWIIKSDFLAWGTIPKNKTCLSIVSACRVDPVVYLSFRNTANYRLPTFGPHGTKLGHSWLQWIIKSYFSGWFDNSEKGDVSWQVRALAGVIPRFHSTSGTLPTTAYLLLDHMAPNWGILEFHWKIIT